MAKKTYRDLTTLERQIIGDVIFVCGRTWKSYVRRIWEGQLRANIGLTVNELAVLQQLRNSHGPSWLLKYKYA